MPIHGYSEVPRPVFSERSLERNGSRYHDESARGIAQKRHVFLSPPALVASLRFAARLKGPLDHNECGSDHVIFWHMHDNSNVILPDFQYIYIYLVGGFNHLEKY